MTLKIVSVGPGDPSFLNKITEETIRSAGLLILRTERHPISSWLNNNKISYCTMDDLYETSEDYEDLAIRIANRLLAFAAENNNTVYAVSDTITDHTVDAVISGCPENIQIKIIPGFSFADFYLPSCRSFFSTADIRICSSSSFLESDYDPSRPVLITELNDDITAGEVKQIISAAVCDENNVIFLNGNAYAYPVQIFEIDRQKKYDHLSAVAAGSFNYDQRNRKTLNDLLSIMDRLRSTDGCPWDRAQTHATLKPYVIEEAWEVSDAIHENRSDHLAEELGDLLFQVVFHASIGKSFDEFTMDDIIEQICEKMIRRHPHVFNKDSDISRERFNTEIWEQIKQSETGTQTPVAALHDVSTALPSLRYAQKILRKINCIPGTEKPSEAEIKASIRKEADSVTGETLGRLLFCCAKLAQHLEIDSEVLLHETVKETIHALDSSLREEKES